jgi:hypothetical protein
VLAPLGGVLVRDDGDVEIFDRPVMKVAA